VIEAAVLLDVLEDIRRLRSPEDTVSNITRI